MLRRLAPWLLVAILTLLLILSWRGCGGDSIDRVAADSLRIADEAHTAGVAAAKAEFQNFLDSQPDAEEMAAHDDSIRRAGMARERAARTRATAQADNLREALSAGLMEIWIPVLDNILAAKDEEREAAVQTEKLVTAEWQDRYNRRFAGVQANLDSLTAHTDSALQAKDFRIAFWQEEAERLEKLPRFQVKAPVGVAAASVVSAVAVLLLKG